MTRWCLATLLLWSCLAQGASTVETFEFADEAQRQRYHALIDEIRCPKCQNTNLSGSDAPIAKDLRGTVYRLVVQEGASDDEVRDFLVARYGDFVLYDPPFRPSTWLLWTAPIIALILGGLVLSGFARRRPEPLSDAERNRAASLLNSESD